VVFDRLYRARQLSRLRLAGEEAFQLLQMEAGLPLPYLDFTPARTPFACAPSPSALGLGESAQAKGAEGEVAAPVLAGLQLESEQSMSYARVFAGETEAGRSMRSLYSPTLKAAIALAALSPDHAAAGTILTLRGADLVGAREVSARVVPLPFL
jgi:glycine cleavage system aminomethyltransferase T